MDPVKYDVEGSFGSVVRRADMALTNRLNQHFKDAGYDITTEQYRVLVNLWNNDGQNQQALSTATRKNKTSMTRLINGLEKRNLVVRVPNKEDQRNKLIYLTPKGKTLPGHLTQIAKKTLREARKGITAEELEACNRVLLKIIENL